MPKPKLTPKQERFCQELLISNNGTKAYKKVYKCTDKAAESGASRSLSIAKVAARMKELRARVLKKTEITVHSVIEMIADTHKRAVEAGDELGAELKSAELLGKHVGAFEKDNVQRAFVLKIS